VILVKQDIFIIWKSYATNYSSFRYSIK